MKLEINARLERDLDLDVVRTLRYLRWVNLMDVTKRVETPFLPISSYTYRTAKWLALPLLGCVLIGILSALFCPPFPIVFLFAHAQRLRYAHAP